MVRIGVGVGVMLYFSLPKVPLQCGDSISEFIYLGTVAFQARYFCAVNVLASTRQVPEAPLLQLPVVTTKNVSLEDKIACGCSIPIKKCYFLAILGFLAACPQL